MDSDAPPRRRFVQETAVLGARVDLTKTCDVLELLDELDDEERVSP